MPRAHPRTRRQARHPATARIRARPRPTTPRPRPHRGHRPGYLLAVRPTHPARRPLGPRPRRPRPGHHARTRARIHMQPGRSRQSIARTTAALTSSDESRRTVMHRACRALTCDYASRDGAQRKHHRRSQACTNLVPRRSDLQRRGHPLRRGVGTRTAGEHNFPLVKIRPFRACLGGLIVMRQSALEGP